MNVVSKKIAQSLLVISAISGLYTHSAIGGNGTWPFRLDGQAQTGSQNIRATATFSRIADIPTDGSASLHCQNQSLDLFVATGTLAIGNKTYNVKAICDSLHSNDVEIIALSNSGEKARFKGTSQDLSGGTTVELNGTLQVQSNAPQSLRLKLSGNL
jgi:hypothetical protein